MEMKPNDTGKTPVFICWSGDLSQLVANQLSTWLPKVIQMIRPFYSKKHIDAGTVWFNKIENELAKSSCGILCLTKDNMASHWMHYEAGGLRKGLEGNRVIPLAIDMECSDVIQPLAELGVVEFNKEGIGHLMWSINKHVNVGSLSEEELKEAINEKWPALDEAVNIGKKELKDKTGDFDDDGETRSPDDMIVEILLLARQRQRQLAEERGNPPRESNGCSMTDQQFGYRMRQADMETKVHYMHRIAQHEREEELLEKSQLEKSQSKTTPQAPTANGTEGD